MANSDSIFSIEPTDLYNFRLHGGQLFTQLMDAILRAHCSVHKITDDKIHDCQRTNLADGGVDTLIDGFII
jgi:hypothetical protein